MKFRSEGNEFFHADRWTDSYHTHNTRLS